MTWLRRLRLVLFPVYIFLLGAGCYFLIELAKVMP